MEQDAKRLLFERLDDCLKVHADILDAENIGSIYELQGLAELHYYLKVEHEFTPAEVEALLSFQDPLDVARWCKEENTHAHSFPICELLKEINADQRFIKMDPEPAFSDKYAELMRTLTKNLYAYQEELLSGDKQALFRRTEETAAVMAAYRYMQDMSALNEKEVDYLLRYDDPLKLIADHWPDSAVTSGEAVLSVLMEDMESPPEERAADLPREKKWDLLDRLDENLSDMKQRRPGPRTISVCEGCHDYLTNHHAFTPEQVDHLLSFVNPLEIVLDYWPQSAGVSPREAAAAMERVMADTDAQHRKYPHSPEYDGEKDRKPSVRDRLKDAARALPESRADKPGRDFGAR